jgi:hypothetical protein
MSLTDKCLEVPIIENGLLAFKRDKMPHSKDLWAYHAE